MPHHGKNNHPDIGNVAWHRSLVDPAERARLLCQQPATLWLTGLSGAGKSTIAYELEKHLIAAGHLTYVLDGDNIRHGLNRDLGFSPDFRHENIRRIAEVARLFNDAGLLVISAFISPYRRDRAMARDIIGAERFFEIHLSAELAVCEERDPKGLYKRARAGEIAEFTGISSPYETPEQPDLTIDTGELEVEACVAAIIDRLAPLLRPPN
jgi:adenylylsulfate kinase